MKRSFQHDRRRAGAFTLTEVLISATLLSLVMMGFTLFYLACAKLVSSGMAQLNVQSTARRGLDQVLYDVRKASSAAGVGIYTNTPPSSSMTSVDEGYAMIVQIPTNSLPAGGQAFHHYYVGNLKGFSNGLTNGTLFYFTSTDGVTLPAAGTHTEIIRGVTNPERVFDLINGVVNVNIRIADENDYDGKQIIFLRSAVAFRNP